MNITVLGTGMVGRLHAAKLVELGHDVTVGTRDPAKTSAETRPDQMGNEAFSEWHKNQPQVRLATYADSLKDAELIVEALQGEVAVEVLKKLEPDLRQKILIDIANPLDFSKGMPPSLFVANTNSLGEQIQAVVPKTHVVKTFNTMSAPIQVNPQTLANSEHHIFLSGNDADAKTKVTELLTSYGWKYIIDLGDITTARGTEMLMPFWLRLWGTLKTPMFNYKIVVE